MACTIEKYMKKDLVKSLLFVSVRVGLPYATVTSISNLSAFFKEVIFIYLLI